MRKLSKLRGSTFTDSIFASGVGYIKGKRAVALPSRHALNRWVKLTLPETGKSTIVQVLDVGPYLWWDDQFVLMGARPLVETLNYYQIPFPKRGAYPWHKISYSGKIPPSKASIDLTPEVWQDLGVDKSIDELKSYSNNNLIVEWFVKNDGAIS
ncbi:MAG: hypothetical protein KC646_10315 [Candidatus Cloacimonetes bacterium]|nr:hypothetical protein [Candidatus Cloacimonadota bacterium]